MKAIQDGHAQRGEADKKDVREDNPVQIDGLLHGRLARSKKREKTHERPRERHSQHGHPGQHRGQRPKQALRKLPHLLARLIVQIVREDGDEGGGHRAFAHQAPKQTGNAIGQDEGVRRRGGAQQQSDALVANVSEDTADDGDERDDRG